MSFISKLFRFGAVSLLIFAFSIIALADTVRLKDGSIIKGRIISFGGGKFTVEIGEGSRQRQLIFSVSEVESIEFEKQSVTYQSKETANRNVTFNGSDANPPAIVPTKIIKNDDPIRQTPSAPKSATEEVKPIGWQLKVFADNTANGWTNSGWVVKKGQRIRITGDGKIMLGRGKSSTPSGLSSVVDEQKLLKNIPTGALIAVIGDDNNEFIYIGAQREFTATRDGALFLGINEGYLDDNSGAFDVKVEILPDGE